MSEEISYDDLEVIETVKRTLYDSFRDEKKRKDIKIGDLLKVIEMKNKLSVAGKAEKKFWEMIDDLRRETLGGKRKTQKTAKKKSK